MKFKIFTIGVISSFLFTGCSFSLLNNDGPKVTKEELKKEKIKSIHKRGVEVPMFEQELLRIATKTQENYHDFQYLLKKRKEIEKEKPVYSIPKNMGMRISLFFEGYSGILLKQVVEKAGYKLLTKDISLLDTKIVSKRYKDTTINDILQDLSVNNGFNVIIKERDNIVYIKAEE